MVIYVIVYIIIYNIYILQYVRFNRKYVEKNINDIIVSNENRFV